MVVSNTIFSNLFGGHNVKPKSANTEKQTFIDPDADIVDAKFTVLDERKPFIYTQNNSENSERFFSAQADNFNFSKSAPFSQAATANIAQSYVSDRSFATGSTKYGSSGSSSFSPSNKEAAQVGRQLAFSA
jgi:hypothetical protein